MQRTGYAAIAKIAMHQREYTVVIRPRDEGLTLHTIFYANEVRAVPEYGQPTNAEVRPQEIQLAEQLVQSLAGPFNAEKYEDTYQKRLSDMIEAKREGKTLTETKGKKLAPVIDLMAALQRSLNQGGESDKKPARRASSGESRAGKKRRAAG
jgi:DNA end-binding protein Ku